VTTSVRPQLSYSKTSLLLVSLLTAVIGVPWYIVRVGLGLPELITFVALWLVVGLAVTAGYHRLFSHRTYQARWPVRLGFLIVGSAAFEGSVLDWAADHRIHHDNVDEERDPYNIQKGFWWAHMGWIFFQDGPPPQTVVRDLVEDPLVRWQSRWYPWAGVTVAFGIPLAVGLATGRVFGCLLIAGVARIVVSHHTTFFINSLCHLVGRQPYSREHSPRDSGIMALLAFGEGYHNYHHSFPFDYRNGIRTWHFDPAKWLIWLLARVGLAANLRRASDAAVLKARVEVQFERAKEWLAEMVTHLREQHEPRLVQAHESLQRTLRELLAVQRRISRPAATAAQPESGEESTETRLAMVRAAVKQARREWKQLLRETRRLANTRTAATA
jgi:stearoyl-CoA desaturase (delta-9 desaturase)